MLALLSDDERARYARIKIPQAARQFLAARARLRTLLAERLQGDPADIGFETGERGKPRLAEHAGLDFSVSHSGGWAMIALSSVGPVGVDIEQHHARRDLAALARRFFHPEESAYVEAGDSAARLQRFYAIWTAKEAIAKATGEGLATDFAAFSVLPAVVESAASVVLGPWRLAPQDAPQGYSAALAWPEVSGIGAVEGESPKE